MTKAYSYLRFSTPEQQQGDSFRRQTQMAKEYAERHGLELDESLRDEGVSAFRGRNARTGALGAFLRAVDDGLVPEGSFLLVESLDRVTRQDPWDALPVFQQIINAGVSIVTLQDGKVFSREEMRAQPFKLIESLIVMIRANEESATKSRRLKAAWVGKRLKAKEKPLTAVVPAWLKLDPKTRTLKVIEDRAEIVRRVYREALEGAGQNLIAARLNREGVPTWKGTRQKTAGMWRRSYIVKLLSNPAVVGTYIPTELDWSSGKRVRKPLDPVPGYYPAIVDEETFQRVQALRTGKNPLRGRHAFGEVRNVLGGLAVCPLCGGTMTLVNKGSSARNGQPSLVCIRAKTGAGCQYKAIRYSDVEEVLVRLAPDLVAEAPAGNGSPIDAELRATEKEIERTEEELEHYLDAIGAGDSPSLMARIRDTENKLDQLRARREELARQQDAAAGPIVSRKLEELGAALTAEPLDRRKANLALRQLLNAVVIDYPQLELRFRWRQGGETSLPFAPNPFGKAA